MCALKKVVDVHTCVDLPHEPCLMCCGSLEAYQDACKLTAEERVPRVRKQLTVMEEAARLRERFERSFGEDSPRNRRM